MALICTQPAAAQVGTVAVSGGRVAGVTTDGIASFGSTMARISRISGWSW